MRRRSHFEQARLCLSPVPLQACDRSVGRPLRAWQDPRAEEFPEERPHYASMRDDDDARAVGVKRPNGRDGLFEPGEKLLRQFGVALLLLGPGVAFEDASVPLAQAA